MGKKRKSGDKAKPLLPKDVVGPVLSESPGSAEYRDGSGRVIVIGYHGHCPGNKSWKHPGLFVMTCLHEVFDSVCHCCDCDMVMKLPKHLDGIEFVNWASQELSKPPQQKAAH